MKLRLILEAKVTFSSGNHITLTISEDELIPGGTRYLVDEPRSEFARGTGRVFDEFPRYYRSLVGAKGQASKIVGEKLVWTAPAEEAPIP